MATILVIEDDKAILDLCTLILKPNYKVLQAKNSDEGLKLFEMHNPDLVIAEIVIPNSKGFFPTHLNPLQLVVRLRNINPTIKLVLYSVLCYDSKVHKQAIDLGAHACLFKNGETDSFKQTVYSLLDPNLAINN